MNYHRYRALLLLGLGLGLMGWVAPASSSPARETTLLVVPGRLPMVQLAFDLAELRPVAILSYRGAARAADPLLFFWVNGAWQYVSPDDFRERRFIAAWPRRVVMLGDDQTLPALLVDEAAWGAEVTRLKTLQIAELINALDAVFHFKEREWKSLARRYGLTLTDVNAPRRKINTYDIPRSKLPLASTTFKQQQDDVPPAVLVEESAPVTPTTAKAAKKGSKPSLAVPVEESAPATPTPAKAETTRPKLPLASETFKQQKDDAPPAVLSEETAPEVSTPAKAEVKKPDPSLK
ncbi:MAG: hypothetical protein HYV35_01445 [Lentisphaerae bacterium]|nr:hypothetical protein [Lentisphaerota bacterium]